MAHEDIWDDSALVNSWNEALAEYKVRPKRQAQATSNRHEKLIVAPCRNITASTPQEASLRIYYQSTCDALRHE